MSGWISRINLRLLLQVTKIREEICLWMMRRCHHLKAIRQEVVHLDRDLAMDLHQMIESTYAVACTCVLLPGQSAGKKDPVLEGDFPSHDKPPVPDVGDDSDSDATVDYREDGLLALAVGDAEGQGQSGTVTPAMQQKYAKEIRAAKEEFRSYLDNDASRLTDRRELGRDASFLTGRWVLTVKFDKNGYFSKFKARWVCRGFQDKFAWDQ
ncbi:unnamed protein product [Symbiodinium microadriaticum]|nr:unnamed protein product [Symbiodinium microadriaticum]